MNNARLLFLAPFMSLSLFVVGCSQHSSDSSSSSQPASGSQDSAADATVGSATGHVHLTGDVTLDHDFGVDACAIGPPGDGLLSGYHMTFKDGDPKLTMLSVVVKDYAKDGSYSPADKSAEGQVASAMTSGVMGPLTLMVSQGEGSAPLAVMLNPESKLNIQISGNGSKGDAEFTDMGTPITIADIDPSGKTKPHGKKISGSVTWSCGKVDHLDPHMNDAVNGMFKKLIPPPSP